MNKFFIIGLMLLPHALFCKDDFKFGKVTPEEVAQRVYPKDSSAGAVILYNIGETETLINPGSYAFNTDYTKRTKIKIFDKNAVGLANQTLVLYNARFSSSGISLYNIKAKTYNLEDGKIVSYDLPKSAVRIDKLDDYHDIVHFAFTNVKAGSVIEYEIKLHIPGVSIPNWYFQDFYPVAYSEFTVNMAEFFQFRKSTKGYLQVPYVDEETQLQNLNGFNYNSTTSKWKMQDIPAFTEEPFISCNDNYITQIDHELLSIKFPSQMEMNFTTSWSEILRILINDPDHGQQISSVTPYLEEEYQKVKDIKDNVERMNACYKAIQSKMSWTGEGSIFCMSPRNAYKETKGSSADINFILLKLLKECNINASPVILSTRDNGFVPRFPSLNKFNYMIVVAKVNGRSYLLDATDKYLLPDMLPPRCFNDKGLVVQDGTNIEWVDLHPKQNAAVINLLEIKLNEDGTIKGKSTLKKTGYAALSARQELSLEMDKGKQDHILKKAANGIEISNYEVLNKDSLDLPVIENFNFSLNQDAGQAAGTILLEPILFEQKTENPLKNPERKYPVEFELPTDNTYIINIALPENVTILEQPKNIAISMPDNSAKFSYQINILNNSIQLSVKYSIKNTLYSQDQYPFLKEFYAQVISKLNEPLLLQRKN